MKNLGRDVGVVGRGLSPAESTVLRGNAYETDEFVVESFKAGDADQVVSGFSADVGPLTASPRLARLGKLERLQVTGLQGRYLMTPQASRSPASPEGWLS